MDKEALLKQLLEGLDEDQLEALLISKKEDKKPKGPRQSVISNKVLDNAGFEAIRAKLDKKIPISERVELNENTDREAPEPREGMSMVTANCHRCGRQETIFPSQMNSAVDGKPAYLCVGCSNKIRS